MTPVLYHTTTVVDSTEIHYEEFELQAEKSVPEPKFVLIRPEPGNAGIGSTVPVGKTDAQKLALKPGIGFVVLGFTKGSAAMKAGIQRYDIVVKLGEAETTSGNLGELEEKIGARKVTVTLYRNHTLKTLELDLSPRKR